MGFWKTIMELFFEDRPEEDDAEFEEAVRQGKINPKYWNYNYNPPKIMEVVKGDYSDWEEDLLEEAKIIILTGARRTGKSLTAYSLAENIAKKNKLIVYSIGTDGME